MSTGAVAGIALAGAVVAVAVTTGVIWFIFRKKYQEEDRQKRNSNVFGGNGKYNELDGAKAQARPVAFGRVERDGVGTQVHEMGAIGRRMVSNVTHEE
jgi:hypothetical protein